MNQSQAAKFALAGMMGIIFFTGVWTLSTVNSQSQRLSAIEARASTTAAFVADTRAFASSTTSMDATAVRVGDQVMAAVDSACRQPGGTLSPAQSNGIYALVITCPQQQAAGPIQVK